MVILAELAGCSLSKAAFGCKLAFSLISDAERLASWTCSVPARGAVPRLFGLHRRGRFQGRSRAFTSPERDGPREF